MQDFSSLGRDVGKRCACHSVGHWIDSQKAEYWCSFRSSTQAQKVQKPQSQVSCQAFKTCWVYFNWTSFHCCWLGRWNSAFWSSVCPRFGGRFCRIRWQAPGGQGLATVAKAVFLASHVIWHSFQDDVNEITLGWGWWLQAPCWWQLTCLSFSLGHPPPGQRSITKTLQRIMIDLRYFVKTQLSFMAMYLL
jgi:hypothetical protein